MIRVFFDGSEIAGRYIMRLNQNVQPYQREFTVGNTICRRFEIDVRNGGYSAVPEEVILYEDNDETDQNSWTRYATLLVDDVNYSNEVYATFSLTDIMVRFNTVLAYTTEETLLEILNRICEAKGITLNTQSFYMDDFVITWEDNLLERDLISYIAEVNGGYAYIDENGNLSIEAYSRKVVHRIDAKTCSAIKVGAKHTYDRVYCELGTATMFYPETTSNDTLYLNPDNILLTGNETYDMMSILQNVHSVIKGFTFYNIEIEQCPIDPNVRAGQLIGAGSWANLQTSDGDNIQTSDGDNILVTDSGYACFICTINYDYNVGWTGGYRLELENGLKQETHVVTAKELVKRIKINVDRELGLIEQSVANITEGVATQISTVEQRADSLEVRVASNESGIAENADRLTAFETSVAIQSDGVRVSQGTEGSYTKFTDSGMEIYAGNEKIAWAEADGFYAKELLVASDNSSSKWHIMENGNSLTFYKEET